MDSLYTLIASGAGWSAGHCNPAETILTFERGAAPHVASFQNDRGVASTSIHVKTTALLEMAKALVQLDSVQAEGDDA